MSIMGEVLCVFFGDHFRLTGQVGSKCNSGRGSTAVSSLWLFEGLMLDYDPFKGEVNGISSLDNSGKFITGQITALFEKEGEFVALFMWEARN